MSVLQKYVEYVLFACCLGILSCTPRTAPKSELPNILLIVADDMGYSDLSCYGGEIPTPNLDDLAHKGVRFTQFYNGARCCPSRASLMTGLHPHQSGLGSMNGDKSGLPGYMGEISNECVTIAEALKPGGYGTYMAGKWHLTADTTRQRNWPLQRGFDRFFGTLNGGGNFFHPDRLMEGNQLTAYAEDFYYTEQIASHTIKYIQEHLKEKPASPFFSYVAFTAPHFPLHAPDTAIQKFEGAFDEGWDILRKKRFDRMKKMGLLEDHFSLSRRDTLIPAWEEEVHKDWEKRKMEVYATQLWLMDQEIGRIVEVLDKNEVLDNTLILFLSDNGGCAEEITMGWYNFVSRLTGGGRTSTGDTIHISNRPDVMPGPENTFQSVGLNWANLQNTPFRMYKRSTEEGGIATPLIVHWPKGIQRPGEIIRTPAYLPDLMPTILAAAGQTYPQEYQGNSILPVQGLNLFPLIKQNEQAPDRKMYWEHLSNKAIRDGDWKLVYSRTLGKWQLFNLREDPVEEKDLAAQFPETVHRLQEAWTQWAWNSKVFPNRETKNQSEENN